MSKKKIKILFAEDCEPDMELALLELEKNGFNFIFHRVDCEEDFKASLLDFEPDVVISDYSMPDFDGMDALGISKKLRPFTPFIVFTGALNEETAVQCIKAGANDYVLKHNTTRLPFALRDALRYRDILFKKSAAEKTLIQSEESYRNLFEKNNAVMIIVNPEKLDIVDANPSALEFYGYVRKDFIGRKITDISRTSEEIILTRFREVVSGINIHFPAVHCTAGGLEKDVNIFSSPVNYGGDSLVHLIIQDVSDRTKALKQLEAALDEKTALVNEIFHRTKNTLQVIIAIMGIKSYFYSDESLSSAFESVENRIRTISFAHDGFYVSDSISRINLKKYIYELSGFILKRKKALAGNVKLDLDLSDCNVLIDTAIPVGLAFYEVIENSISHAFKGKIDGAIKVGLTKIEENYYSLTIQDNGTGLPYGMNLSNSGTSGFQLLLNFIEYQLRGSVVLEETGGVKITMNFKDDVHRERV